jgi:hypothetical protein
MPGLPPCWDRSTLAHVVSNQAAQHTQEPRRTVLTHKQTSVIRAGSPVLWDYKADNLKHTHAARNDTRVTKQFCDAQKS